MYVLLLKLWIICLICFEFIYYWFVNCPSIDIHLKKKNLKPLEDFFSLKLKMMLVIFPLEEI